jgi:hypothetical protein
MASNEERLRSIDWRAFTPDDSPMTPLDVMADPLHKDLATPEVAVGDPAFDFELPIYDFSDGGERATDRRLRLSAAARERPVALIFALIFGSYT